MGLTIAYPKFKKKRNLVLIDNATYQRETLSKRPIRQPLNKRPALMHSATEHFPIPKFSSKSLLKQKIM